MCLNKFYGMNISNLKFDTVSPEETADFRSEDNKISMIE